MTTHYPDTVTLTVPTPIYTELNFSQAGAVQNTWYPALEGSNIEVLCFAAGVTVADETIEIQVTIDGTVISTAAGQDCLFASNLHTSLPAVLTCTTGAAVFTQGAPAATITSLDSGLPWLKGAAVKIEVRKTTAAGASAVTGIGVYHEY